jgi:WS/DGAT/MGAT family acyltransferase
VCGGALRSYLREIGQLPRETLLAGVPVSVKDEGAQHGNALSTMICPFGTQLKDPARRLRSIARTTRRAKQDLRALSRTARQDYMNLILLPAIVFTLAHAATSIPPPFNVIVSNVPGPAAPLYLGGARLEAVYPLSVISDAQALNITGIGCGPRLCVALTACPDDLPGIERFDRHLQQAWSELRRSL